MKRKILIPLLVAALLIALAVPVLATNGTVQATLNYRDLKVTLNGNLVVPRDVNGNPIEPFIIDGTTYVPVRGISALTGLSVDWDPISGTIILTGGGSGGATNADVYYNGASIPAYTDLFEIASSINYNEADGIYINTLLALLSDRSYADLIQDYNDMKGYIASERAQLDTWNSAFTQIGSNAYLTDAVTSVKDLYAACTQLDAANNAFRSLLDATSSTAVNNYWNAIIAALNNTTDSSFDAYALCYNKLMDISNAITSGVSPAGTMGLNSITLPATPPTREAWGHFSDSPVLPKN